MVGIGSSVEASVLASANLVDAGIPSIWAKALSPEHGRILSRIGVHHVIFPEADTGRRVAHLVNGKLMDYIEFDDGFAIVKMRPRRRRSASRSGRARSAASTATIVGVKSPGGLHLRPGGHQGDRPRHAHRQRPDWRFIERLASRP